MIISNKRRTWKRAPVKKMQTLITENKGQKIERIQKDGKPALAITYKQQMELKHLSFVKKSTLYLNKKDLPFSKLLSYDRTKLGYRGVWSFCEGKTEVKWEISHYGAFGDFLGKMHKHASNYTKNSMTRPPLFFSISEKYHKLKDSLPRSFDTIGTTLDSIEKNWPVFLQTGLVHTDLYQNNVHFKHGKVSGIAQNHNMQIDILLYDVASIIKSLHFSRNSDIDKKEAAFFAAYTKHTPLTKTSFPALALLTSAKLLQTALLQIEKHLTNSSYNHIHLNAAAISLIHAEKALHLYK